MRKMNNIDIFLRQEINDIKTYIKLIEGNLYTLENYCFYISELKNIDKIDNYIAKIQLTTNDIIIEINKTLRKSIKY